jgi:3'(2'), 5'-bisphosphate nucleotidase
VKGLEELAEAASRIAVRAAEAILAVYAGEFAVQRKADDSLLTAADLAANRLIVDALGALDPVLPVLSEESAPVDWRERGRWTRYWLVDPLDGTREFVRRNGEFSINIALVQDQQPVVGIVQAPASGELACAWRGGGSWHAGSAGAPLRRLACVRRRSPLRIASSHSLPSARHARLQERLGPGERMPLGSALKFVRIASGEADLYLRLGATSEWDTAAGQCVLEEAGGAVFDLHGHPLRYNTRPSLENPEFAAVGDPAADWSPLLRPDDGLPGAAEPPPRTP